MYFCRFTLCVARLEARISKPRFSSRKIYLLLQFFIKSREIFRKCCQNKYEEPPIFFFWNFSFLDFFLNFFGQKSSFLRKNFGPLLKNSKNDLKLKNSKNKKLVALRIRSGNIFWKFHDFLSKTVGGDRFGVWWFFRFCVLIIPPDTPKVEIFFLISSFLNEYFQKNQTCSYKISIFQKK